MTDNSNLVPNNKAITSDALFNLKPSAANAKSYRVNVPTYNKSIFAPSDTLMFKIPSGRRNTFLDQTMTYLKFTIINNDTNNSLNLDHCGASFINTLNIFQNGQLIESIINYNVLYNYLIDFQMNISSSLGLSCLYGTSEKALIDVINTNYLTQALITGSTIAAATNGISFGCANSGFTSARCGAYIPKSGGRLTVCIPILSGIIGTMCDKMLPLFLLNDDIDCQFVLENLIQSCVSNPNTTPLASAWSIVGAELICQVVEMSDFAISEINTISPLDQPIYIHGCSYRHYSGQLNSGTTDSVTYPIGSRFGSLKSLICLPRRSTEISDQASFSLSSRVNPNFVQYNWRIAGLTIPQKPVILNNTNLNGGYSEAFIEIMKSFHSLDNISMGTSVTKNAYFTAETAIALENIQAPGVGFFSYANGFALATELESICQRNDQILAGCNTNGQLVYFEANIGSTGPAANYILNFFSYFDQILEIRDGSMYLKF